MGLCLTGNGSLCKVVVVCLVTIGCSVGSIGFGVFIKLFVLTLALLNMKLGLSSRSPRFCSLAIIKFFLKRGAKSLLDSTKSKESNQFGKN